MSLLLPGLLAASKGSIRSQMPAEDAIVLRGSGDPQKQEQLKEWLGSETLAMRQVIQRGAVPFSGSNQV